VDFVPSPQGTMGAEQGVVDSDGEDVESFSEEARLMFSGSRRTHMGTCLEVVWAGHSACSASRMWGKCADGELGRL
jgi:hypothetical protein